MMGQQRAFLLRFSVSSVVTCTMALPFLSILLSILLSIAYNYKQVTKTHCAVPNVVPSISAAVGDYSPQKYIFRGAIGLHAPLVYGLQVLYYNRFKSWNLSGFFRLLNLLQLLARWIEITCLLILAVVASSENFHWHEMAFILFMFFSYVEMMAMLAMTKYGRPSKMNQKELHSFRTKLALFIVNAISFALAVYFYERHNAYCEPYVYSLFATLEYIVVMANIGFHGTVKWDFDDCCLTVGKSNDWSTRVD
ncbi:post-GPI attachment to proteins factor 2-like [Oscarella lobularis]|uniref:post-GPI attachment to proteins factor 2-like n=1 Tax=Oscarella lobularis TaxID=121494 RepID=UPI0033134FBD